MQPRRLIAFCAGDSRPENPDLISKTVSPGCRQFGRDLQRWMPDDGEEAHEFHLEEDSTGWDQFAINKEKFGVETTFNEEIYTTRLDKKNAGISEEEAARIAREIETEATQGFKTGRVNYHLLEERGQEVDDGGVSGHPAVAACAAAACTTQRFSLQRDVGCIELGGACGADQAFALQGCDGVCLCASR